MDRVGWPDAWIEKVAGKITGCAPRQRCGEGRATRGRDPAASYVTRDRVRYFGSRQSSSLMTVSRVSAAASTSASST